MSDTVSHKALLHQYLINRRDELINANRHDIANEFEMTLDEFSEFFSTESEGEAARLRTALEELEFQLTVHDEISPYFREDAEKIIKEALNSPHIRDSGTTSTINVPRHLYELA